MSIRLPDFNLSAAGGSTAVVLTMPNAATSKPAATGAVTLFWFRTRALPFENGSNAPTLLTRGNGHTSGSDGYIRMGAGATQLTLRWQNGGTIDVNPASIPLTRGRNYLAMHIVNATAHHFTVCEVGGTPVTNSQNGTSVYNNAYSSPSLWNAIGGATGSANNKPYAGLIEDLNVYLGTFPEVGGVPDPALVAGIADGTIDPTALAALLNGGSGGTHQTRYRMRDETDLSSSVGTARTMTAVIPGSNSRATGAALYTGGPIRRSALTPAFTRDAISQVLFGTPGNAATAFADIRVEGGSYTGLPTLAKVQARLLDESQAVVRDWTDLPSTAPSAGAGTWSASTPFAAVPMRASYLRVEFRALDSGGAVLATETGYGLRGAGFHAITQAQSQLMFLFETGAGMALPSGIRLCSLRQANTAAPLSVGMLQSGDVVLNRLVARGIRQMAIEINARYPGVPIQIDTFGHPGTSINEFIPAGGINTVATAGDKAAWAGLLKNSLNIVQPYYMIYMQHSQDIGNDYGSLLSLLIEHVDASIGPPIKNLHVSVPRYQGGGTDERGDNNANKVQKARSQARALCAANPSRNQWMGSWSTVQSVEEPNVSDGPNTGAFEANPHPSDRDLGQGRAGGMMGWALMSAARAVPDVPLGIARVRADGADAVIEFASVA